jgi:Protein of unknown function (DUF3102)
MEHSRGQTGDHSLVVLIDTINTEHRLAEISATTALEHARKAGEALTTAKQKLKHGEWLPWLEQNCHFSVRLVQQYMKLAREWQNLVATSNAQRVAHLTVRDALELLAEARDDFDVDAAEPSKIPFPPPGHVTHGFNRGGDYVRIDAYGTESKWFFCTVVRIDGELAYSARAIHGDYLHVRFGEHADEMESFVRTGEFVPA